MSPIYNEVIRLITSLAYFSYISGHSSTTIIKLNRLTAHVISMGNSPYNTGEEAHESNNNNDEDDYKNTNQNHFSAPSRFSGVTTYPKTNK